MHRYFLVLCFAALAATTACKSKEQKQQEAAQRESEEVDRDQKLMMARLLNAAAERAISDAGDPDGGVASQH